MRKITALVLAATMAIASTGAMAQHHGHHGHGGSNWVAPLIIGGVIGAVITSNRPTYTQPVVIYQDPPVVYQQQPVYNYRPMYKMVDVYIPECNCTRTVQVQIN